MACYTEMDIFVDLYDFEITAGLISRTWWDTGYDLKVIHLVHVGLVAQFMVLFVHMVFKFTSCNQNNRIMF